MGKTKYIIYLSEEEKEKLNKIAETAPAVTSTRAKILLGSDFANREYCSAQKLAARLGTSPATVQAVRAEYGKAGLDSAIFPKGTLSYDRRALMDDEKRKTIIDMIKNEHPPYGSRRWTVMSICDECVKRGIFDYVAKSVIQKLLNQEQIDLKNITYSSPSNINSNCDKRRIECTSVVSERGQLSIPLELQHKLNLNSGDKVRFSQSESGEIIFSKMEES